MLVKQSSGCERQTWGKSQQYSKILYFIYRWYTTAREKCHLTLSWTCLECYQRTLGCTFVCSWLSVFFCLSVFFPFIAKQYLYCYFVFCHPFECEIKIDIYKIYIWYIWLPILVTTMFFIPVSSNQTYSLRPTYRLLTQFTSIDHSTI